MLARTLETAYLSTVLVTMMPYWSEKIGVPRTLAVEFPFGHTLGAPHDAPQQKRVILEVLRVLAEAPEPGGIVHSGESWKESVEDAIQSWQPKEPSPIIAELTPKFRDMMRQHRADKKP